MRRVLPVALAALPAAPGAATPVLQRPGEPVHEVRRAVLPQERWQSQLRDLRLLEAVREQAARPDEPDAGRLRRLLGDFEQGRLTAEQLRARAIEVDPGLAQREPVREEVPTAHRLAWHDRSLGSFTVGPRPVAAGPAEDPPRRDLVVRVLENERAFVDLQPWLAAPDRYRFVRNEQELHSVHSLGGVELEPGAVVWWFDEEQARVLDASEERQVFCGALVNFGPAGGASAVDVRMLRVWASFARTPLPWSDEDGVYASDVVLGIDVAAGVDRPAELPNPLRVLLEAQGAGASVAPDAVVLTTVGEGEGEARLAVARHGPDVALVTRIGSRPFEHAVSVSALTDRIVLTASPTSIPGFGMGTAALSLERLAEDGTVHAPDAPLEATLSVVRGWLEATTIEVPANAGRADGPRLRSAGVGAATVVVRTGELEATVQVLYEWPWALLIACLAGGALGGWLRSAEREGPLAKRPLMRTLVGAGVALVVVLAVLSGIAEWDILPEGAAATLSGALVLAALSGFGGRNLLEKLLAGRSLGGAGEG